MKKILSVICIINLLIIPSNTVFAENRVDYNVSQQQMLKVVYDYITFTCLPSGINQYTTHISCSPKIWLPAGNCYIDFVMYSQYPYTKELAYQAAVSRYSLTAHKGTYNIFYNQNSVTIQCINISNNQNTIITNYNYGTPFACYFVTRFVFNDNTYIDVKINATNYNSNAATEKIYLEKISGKQVTTYFVTGTK